MRRPVVRIVESENNVWSVEVYVPETVWVDDQGEEHREIPSVFVGPYPTHVSVGVVGDLKPRIKQVPSPGYHDLEDVFFGFYNWMYFWEQVDSEIRMAASPEEKFRMFWEGNEARLPLWWQPGYSQWLKEDWLEA